MSIRRLSASLLALFTLSVFAAEEVSMNPYGGLKLGGDFNLSVFHAGPNWSTNKRMTGTTLIADTVAKELVTGKFAVNEHEAFDVRVSLEKTGENRWRYRAAFRSARPIGGVLFLSMEIPVQRGFAPAVDGELLRMPEQYKDLTVYDTPRGETDRTVSFQSDTGRITLSGEFTLRIQDNRRFKRDFYNLRIPFASGEVTEAEITLDIRFDTLRSTPVDISRAANMGFADSVPGDGKGGWTDQGPENDLYNLPAGEQNFGGIRFRILDGDKSCIVVSADPNRNFPESRPIELAGTDTHEYLYLLHGIAWGPPFKEEAGRIRVEYDGASPSVFSVKNGIDTGNWWRPAMSLSNGLLLWSGDNRGGGVGLFGSGFRLKDAPVRRISFEPVRGVWGIAAVSFTNMPLERPEEEPVVIQADKNWIKTAFNAGVTVEGSPLDFSFLLDAPAGKHGRVINDGKGGFLFENAPGKPVRFWGTNLCQSALFPTHEESDKLAAALARCGYNSIRLHQFERGLWDRQANDTLTFNPEQLDRFFYLIAKLKERGIYLTTDIFATRPIRPGDGIEECEQSDDMDRKVLNFFSPSAMRNWAEYAKRLLTTRNPYTGMTLAEDPALYSVNLDNEAPIFQTWDRFPKVAHVPGRYFAAYLKEKGLPMPEPGGAYQTEFRRYLELRQYETQREQTKILRDLGCRFLITNLNNYTGGTTLQPFRAELDLTDFHSYHDHPIYPQAKWNVPVSFTQQSPISNFVPSLSISWSTRIFGKPMIVTELDFCAPNAFRASGGALTGAYGALQDWGGIYRFAYTHSINSYRKPGIIGTFDTVFDPVRTLADRQTALLFLRGDVSSSKEKAVIGWTGSEENRYPEEFVRLGFFGQVGSLPGAGDWKKNLSPAFRAALERQKSGVITSSTGEIEIDVPGNRLKVTTGLSEAFCLPQGEIAGKFLSLAGIDTFSAVSVHSLDGKPLAESRSVLLLHLTDAANTGMSFRNAERKLLTNWGTLPLLIRSGKGEAMLRFSPAAGTPVVTQLNFDGSVKKRIRSEAAEGVVRLPLNTAETMLWHIAR